MHSKIYCPIIRDKCKGEKCAFCYVVDTDEDKSYVCGLALMLDRIINNSQ